MDELLVRHMTLLIKCMSDWTFLWPCYLSCVIKGQLLPYSTRFHLGLCLCDLYMWMELVPPLLFITRFLRALLQSSLSLQTLFWLFSEGGLHLCCQETIRPPRDIFLRAVLEPSIQSFAAALNICFMTCGSDFNGKGRVINEVPLQRGGRKKNRILARGSCSGFVDEKKFLTQLMYLSSFYLCFPLHNRKMVCWQFSYFKAGLFNSTLLGLDTI